MIKGKGKNGKVRLLLVCVLLFFLIAASSIAMGQASADPDEPLIRVSKTVSGLTQDQINELSNFKITITSQSDATRTEDLFLSTGTIFVEENGDITYKWELDGWPAGTYIVTETEEELENYSVITENAGTVTTEAATIKWDTVLWKKPNTEVYNDLSYHAKYNPDGIIPNIVATKLTTGEGVFVWTLTRQSASQQVAIIEALSGYNELGLTADNGYWYSGEDIAGEDFYFRGYQIQYDYDTGILHVPEPSQWSLIVSGAYEYEGGDPADIAVKNTYTRNTVDVTIEKEITGNYGDLDRSFSFTATVDRVTYDYFVLGHDDSHTLSGLPAGATLILTEDSDGYDVTVMVGEDEIAPNDDGEYIIDLSDDDITITVTNDKDITIDVGISLDSLPYIIIMAVVVIGLAVMIIGKRNFGKQD